MCTVFQGDTALAKGQPDCQGRVKIGHHRACRGTGWQRAHRYEERFMNGLAADRATTPGARRAFLAVCREAALEVARLARSRSRRARRSWCHRRRAPRPSRRERARARRGAAPAASCRWPGHSAAWPATAPRRRRCCPTPLTSDWSSRARFSPVRRRRMPATTSSGSYCGSNGSRAMCAISGGSPAPFSEYDRPPEHPLVDEPHLGARRRRSGTAPAGASRPGHPTGWTRNWPLMPRWVSTASPESSGSHRYLPRRAGPANR
jgi:hypothetical protein